MHLFEKLLKFAFSGVDMYTASKKSYTPISVYAIKHACYSGLGEGQGEGQHLCKLEVFLKKTIKYI